MLTALQWGSAPGSVSSAKHDPLMTQTNFGSGLRQPWDKIPTCFAWLGLAIDHRLISKTLRTKPKTIEVRGVLQAISNQALKGLPDVLLGHIETARPIQSCGARALWWSSYRAADWRYSRILRIMLHRTNKLILCQRENAGGRERVSAFRV